MEQLKNYIREDLLDVRPYESARHEFTGTANVWLDANENPLATDYNRYPDPFQSDLKAVISGLKNIPTERLFLGNGSDEVLDLILRLTCQPYKDTVAALDPSYGMYEVLATLNALNYRKIALNERFEWNIDAVKAQLEGVKVFFICRPNNPTGNLFPLDDLRTLLQQFKGVLVVDEAYIDFCPEASAAALVAGFPNLVVVQTLSKAYGMAGLRIGMAIARPEWVAALNAIKPPYNISSLTQQTALELLRSSDWSTIRANIIRERERLEAALKASSKVTKVFPSEANFILFRIPQASAVYNYLTEQGIVVRNRSSQFNCADTLRITVGTAEENTRFINALNNY